MNSEQQLHHILHQSGPAHGMGGLTQVLLCLFRDVEGFREHSGGHGAARPNLWRHIQNTNQQPPRLHPIDHIQHVTKIFLTLDNQKNAIQIENVSHSRSESPAALQFERPSTSPSACKNTETTPPPQSATILTTKGFAWLAP